MTNRTRAAELSQSIRDAATMLDDMAESLTDLADAADEVLRRYRATIGKDDGATLQLEHMIRRVRRRINTTAEG